MNNIENLNQLISSIYQYPHCDICKNSRQVENLEDSDYLNKYVDNPPLVICQCTLEINRIRALALNSRMSGEELKYTFKEYDKYLKIDINSTMTDNFEPNKVLNKYIENIKKVIEHNTNMYIYSLSPMLSKIVGCSLLNEFIKKSYSVRIYDGSEIINSIIKSFKNDNDYYSDNIIDAAEHERSTFYFDEFENENDIIYIHNLGFKDINGATVTRFKNTLQKRRRNNRLTLLSSNEKYYDNVYRFELESFIDVCIGNADIVKSQYELYKGFIE